MSRPKQILFYGLMAVITLVVIEGMAQAAYYIAYGEFNGGGPAPAGSLAGAAADDADDADADADARPYWLQHPYYGYTRPEAGHPMNQAPPPRREEGVILIALVGGSVGLGVTEAFRSALKDWFRDQDIPLRPVALGLAYNGMKQPQQVIQIANSLIRGGEYDVIVNLDGHNELFVAHTNYYDYDISPFFPLWWQQLVTVTAADKLLIGRIAWERERHDRRQRAARAAPWRWSAMYGIISRYRLERTAARVLALNRELAASAAGYSLERDGPQWHFQDQNDLRRAALRVWYRGSVMLDDLSRTAGAEYYHFLQPNQYVPDSKPFTAEELANAYDPNSGSIVTYNDGYPQLLRWGDELRRHGVNYHDLTQIFADNRETLYRDDCCHLNERGYELLAEAMVQRLAPALQRRAESAAATAAAGGRAAAGTALDSTIRETAPDAVVNKLYFDVRLADDGALHYRREGCTPADVADPFYLHITPADPADLQPWQSEAGFDNLDFDFNVVGVRDDAGGCAATIALPEYDIASIQTGQYQSESRYVLWTSRIYFAEQ